MHLKQLQIHGFKTFAEKTQIVFTPGVTCIVGPNGSGKSNISDAVLWVLGENNVRSLRGQTAQDIIFAGNERRRPLGMAEVSLTLDNSARILPLDFSEITVTRRIYRSGETECFINKVACRLRDIYELFLDTGVGRDAYSLINQGEIDQILSVRAEDRRAIFEEAAGIKKYRVRKREAERKLEQTQANLLRVADIVSEIEAQLGPLQRQAGAARRYRELAGKLHELETAWYGARIRRLDAERESLAGLVRELNAERSRLDAEMTDAQETEKTARERLQHLDGRIDELRQVESAAVQRGAAAEAEKARAEERAGEVQRRLRALDKELEEVAERIRDQVRRAEAAAREEAELKAEVDGMRGELREAQAAAQEKAGTHDTAAKELERQRQAAVARARRQAELEARVQAQEARLQSLAQERGRAGTAVEDVEAELERLTLERESFLKAAAEQKAREQAIAAELEPLRQAAQAADRGLAAARSQSDAAQRAFNSHVARLQALSELGERGDGGAAGARLLLDAGRRGYLRGQYGLLVDRLRVPEGLEKAVEAALGVYGDAVLCDSPEDARAALDWLRVRKATALLLPGVQGAGGRDEGVRVQENSSCLAAMVSSEDEAALWWVHTLLEGAILCDSLPRLPHADPASAPTATNGNSHGSPLNPEPRTLNPQTPRTLNPKAWVTRSGEWLSCSGAISGGPLGAEGSAAAALARKRELDRLREEAPSLERAAVEAREAVGKVEAEIRRSQNALREKQSQADRARMEQVAQTREAERRKGDVDRARARVDRVRADLARIERDLAATHQTLDASVRELESARGEQSAVSNQQSVGGADPNAERRTPNPEPRTPNAHRDPLEGAQQALRRLESEWRAAENAVTELRVRLAQQEQRLQGAMAGSRRVTEAGAFLDRQRADLLREQTTLSSEREQREQSFAQITATVEEASSVARRARDELEALTAERTTRAGELHGARARSQELGGRLRELMERSHRAEVELTAVNTQREHLSRQWIDASVAGHSLEVTQAEELDEPLSLTVEALLETWDPHAAETTLTSYSDPEGEIGRLRRQIRSLGAVNPDAVEQYAEARERYDFLTTQRADLEAAREKLEEAIREIDAASRETFMRAFREIADAFDEMFKKLFGGGTTELRLTDPNDVLETGIDVIVQPPGKKQQNLLLLSGGERALTAAAMLFALLKVRPSPFCVMDEVDAPLDESNVGRFTQTLRDFSSRTQFVVVTHNRGTMEGADTLYGVTMEERGVSKVLSCTLSDPVVAQVEAEQRSGGALAGAPA